MPATGPAPRLVEPAVVVVQRPVDHPLERQRPVAADVGGDGGAHDAVKHRSTDVPIARAELGRSGCRGGRGARPAPCGQGADETTKLAMSPSSVAHWVTPNATVSTPVIVSAAVSDTGTRTGDSSPSGAGFIHISRATLA